MKRTVFLILMLCYLVGSLMAQENKTLSRFEGQKITGIDASSCWYIEITEGAGTQATISFPARFEKNVVFELNSDGTLKLGINGEAKMQKDEKFTAVVVCSALHRVELSGACKLNWNGKFTADKMDIDLSGASQVAINGGLMATTLLKVELSGASKLSALAESGQVDIDLSGASSLTLKGKAGSGKVEVSGAAKGEMGEFVMQKAMVDLSGASKANMNASELIEGEISGASKLSYQGTAVTRVDVSGASKLKHE